MDPPSSNSVTTYTHLLPEHLTQILLSNAKIKQGILNQKKCFNEVQRNLQKVKESKDDFKEKTNSLFSCISEFVRDSFPVLQEFTDEHETAVRDFIYFEVLGWNATNHQYWVQKKGTLERAHPKAFQETNKQLGGQIVKIVRTLKKRHNDKYNKHIRNKPEDIMPADNQQINEQTNDKSAEEKIDYNIDIMQIDQRIGNNIGSILQVRIFNFLLKTNTN